MAVAPLFVADMTTLRTRLRLDGAKAASALAVIDQAVEDVRIGFYDRLGATRVAALVAIGYSENPTTANGVLRAKANSVEVKWVRVLLLRRLPVLFIDAQGLKQQVWNDESGFASGPERALRDEIEKLEAEIEEALLVLAGDEDPDEAILNVSTIGPDETPDLPGASVWPGRRTTNNDLTDGD